MDTGRRRQHLKDAKLRKRLSMELSRRQKQVGHTRIVKKGVRSSIMALKPLPPLEMKASTNVRDACQYMAAKRANAVLVLDRNNHVAGIFTAKDLALKVVGNGLDPRQVRIEDIMTPDPICVDTNTSVADALDLMVTRGFRHLPLLHQNKEIVGVLDVSECFYKALSKMEKASESSKMMHEALKETPSEPGETSMLSYMEALQEHVSGPKLSAIGAPPALFCDSRSPVSEVAKVMKDNGCSAILVTDQETVVGIVTTKDIVLRVLAAGLDARQCSVIRVMTPNPDVASLDTSAVSALRSMREGKYLNMPAFDTSGTIVCILDVLKLIYVVLEQIRETSFGDESEPHWDRFWIGLEDESDCMDSESLGDLSLAGSMLEADEEELERFLGEHHDFADELRELPELEPEDSLSRAGMSVVDVELERSKSQFIFKFKSPSGRMHRVGVANDADIETFRSALASKLSASELAELGGLGVVEEGTVKNGFAAAYKDDDGDLVSISSTHDVQEAIALARRSGLLKTEVVLHGSGAPLTTGYGQVLPLAVGCVAALGILAAIFGRQR